MDTRQALKEAGDALQRYSGAITISRDVLSTLVEALREPEPLQLFESELLEPNAPLRQLMIERERDEAGVLTNRITVDYPSPEEVAQFLTSFDAGPP